LQAFGSTAVHLSYLARGIAAVCSPRRINLWAIADFAHLRNSLASPASTFPALPLTLLRCSMARRRPNPVLAARPDMLADLRKRIHPRK